MAITREVQWIKMFRNNIDSIVSPILSVPIPMTPTLILATELRFVSMSKCITKTFCPLEERHI